MNGQAAVSSAEWIVEIGPGDPEWSDHFLTGFEQWLIEGGFSVGSIRQHYLRIAKWLVTLTLPPQPEESPEAIVTRWWSIVESREDISALHKEQCHHAFSKVRD